MGKIKKLHQGALVGEGSSEEVYPVTAAQAVYDKNNTSVQDILEKIDGNIAMYTCGTAAGTAAKTITAPDFKLMTAGGSIKVKFTYANTASSGVTLAIGSTTAKPVKFNGADASNTNTWGANEVVDFYYDGTNWVGNSTTVSVSQITSTGEYNLKIGNEIVLSDIQRTILSKNIIDYNACTSGKIIRPNGDIEDFADASYYLTDYIPVNGQDIIANTFQDGTFGSYDVFDADKIFLRVIQNNAQYTYQEGDSYVRAIIHKVNGVNDFYGNYGNTLLPYSEFYTIEDKISELQSDITDIQAEILVNASVSPVNDFDDMSSFFNAIFTSYPIARNFTGTYIVKELIYKAKSDQTTLELHKLSLVSNVLTDNGIAETILLDSSWLDETLGDYVYRIPFDKTIDYIPAPKGFYAINSPCGDVGYIAVGTNINNVSDNDKQSAIAFGMVGYSDQSQIDENKENIQSLDTRVTALENSASVWSNKKVGFLGDSITANGYYITKLVQMTGMNAVNYGIGGTHIAAKNSSVTDAFENRVSGMANDLDAVVVFGGTNDFGHNNTYGGGTAQFGTFDDYTDADIYSFYAGCHRTFKQLYDKYRGKPIIVMTPLHHGYEVDNPEITFNDDGTITQDVNTVTNKTFKQYVDAIKEVASYYSFIVIDAYAESGLNPCLETSDARYYFSDGLHPNQTGGNRLAMYMLPYLEQIYKMFY